ncbi:hypothetical protein [uncultured Draconibacterium sp.]|uniref:hypothetical protein n=1 Tax=uncultured Draconibacterium sp. TaxID=1573823 RepID=UPI0029C8E296|nr:hypothetical protein [uncultured Draconibacterium sp.]
MKQVKNMRELELMKENLEYRQKLNEKQLLGSSVGIINNFTDGLKDWAFEFGTHLFLDLIRNRKNRAHETEEEDE